MDTHGIVLIDKPMHITSRKAVDRVMSILKAKRAGHFGSLDPSQRGSCAWESGRGPSSSRSFRIKRRNI